MTKKIIQNNDYLLNLQNLVLVIEIWNFEFIWNLVLVFCLLAIKCTKFTINVQITLTKHDDRHAGRTL